MTHLTCKTHGRQKETFVCVHVIETLKDGEPRGFWWSFTDGAHEAVCSACNDLDEDAFAKVMEKSVSSLCFGCFRQAAEINGIILA